MVTTKTQKLHLARVDVMVVSQKVKGGGSKVKRGGTHEVDPVRQARSAGTQHGGGERPKPPGVESTSTRDCKMRRVRGVWFHRSSFPPTLQVKNPTVERSRENNLREGSLIHPDGLQALGFGTIAYREVGAGAGRVRAQASLVNGKWTVLV